MEIGLDDFQKMELVIGTIKEVQDHPDADKLYLLKVSLPEGERQLVAGIKPYYNKAELIGKKIVILKNLKPAVIRGVRSEGMLLAAEGKDGISLLTVDREVEDGARVR